MASENIRVLIVDDEEAVLRLFSTYLTSHGLSCDTATTGEAALGLLETNSYHVAVLDILMPGMSGWELATRALERWPDMRLVAVTGLKPSPELRDFGFEEIMQKPVSTRELLDICRRSAGD